MKKLYALTAFLLIFSLNSSAQYSSTNDIQSKIDDETVLIAGARYYFYPNLDAYYDTTTNLYLFESKQNRGQIVKAKEVPSGYRGYSLYNGVRVAITDYAGDEPFSKIAEHRKQFPKKYTSRRQPPKADKNLALN